MSNNFHIGQRVCCIKRGLWVSNTCHFPINNQAGTPQYGEVYTVADICDIGQPDIYITLKECDGWLYNATRFRPVTTRTTDITVFQELQTPKLENV